MDLTKIFIRYDVLRQKLFETVCSKLNAKTKSSRIEEMIKTEKEIRKENGDFSSLLSDYKVSSFYFLKLN